MLNLSSLGILKMKREKKRGEGRGFTTCLQDGCIPYDRSGLRTLENSGGSLNNESENKKEGG